MSDDFLETAFIARLLETGGCQDAARHAALIRRYENAGWLVPGTRRGQWVVRGDHVRELEERLTVLRPNWKADFELLRKHGLDPRKLQDIEGLPALRQQGTARGFVNRRNWNAVGGLGPKRRSVLQTDATLTRDWVLRVRPNRGLIGMWDSGVVDLWEVAQVWTECVMPERRWLGFHGFEGTLPTAIVTCENLGAYIDLPLPEGVLCVFAPGRDTQPAVALLEELPGSKWIHFGDLDPEGLAIADQIAKTARREVRRFIPSYAIEYLAQNRGQKRAVQWASIPGHSVFSELKQHSVGMFQEVFMLDPRLMQDLARAIQSSAK